MVPRKMRNIDVFDVIEQKDAVFYEIYGMVCYWGNHYISYFRSGSKDEYWVCYDDNIVSKLDSWKDVISKNLKGHFHPTLMFYRKLDKPKPDEVDLTNDEINKMMSYCMNYDKEVTAIYKNDEVLSSRLRPTTEDKRLSERKHLPPATKSLDERQADLLNELGRDYTNFEFNKIVSNKSYGTSGSTGHPAQQTRQQMENSNKEGREKNDKKANDKEKLKKKNDPDEPQLLEDEWLCEIKSCKNINKITSYTCLSKYHP
jgi:hypothetical protein